MAIQVQLRRGTAAQNNAFTGAIGEVSFDTTNNQLRVHDGSTAGGFKIGTGDFPTGTANVALGNTALDSLDGSSPGGNNVAVGHNALTANTTASNNVAVGSGALATSTTATDNTAVGFQALTANTSGADNVAVGDEAAHDLTTGSRNTIVGSKAGDAATTTDDTTLVGYGAGGGAIMTGHDNVAVGSGSLSVTTSGASNVAVGTSALAANTTGDFNTAVGTTALDANTTADYNTAVGYNALTANTTGTGNVAVGVALGANTTANDNTAMGNGALGSNTTGASNTAIGRNALVSNTTGSESTAIGIDAGNANTTGRITAVGRHAVKSNTTATGVTGIGYRTLRDNTTGANNTALGGDALIQNTTATENTALGYAAGYSNTTSSGLTYVGRAAGYSTTGQHNTFVGEGAGYYITSGAKNTILGRFNGNQDNHDMRTDSNTIVVSDGDGNVRVLINSEGYFRANSVNATRVSGNTHTFAQDNNDTAAFRIENQHGSFVDSVLKLNAHRSANSGYNILNCLSGNASDNEFILRGDGNAYADGSWNGGGADYAEYFEWADGNSSNQDRTGYTVVLDGEKIKLATSDDTAANVIGAVSVNPSVVGDSDIDQWKGKYLKDEFGSYQTEEYTETWWIETVVDQEAADEVLDDNGYVITPAKERKTSTRKHSYNTDKIPDDVTVPDDATVETQDAKGNTLVRRKLNPDYNPDTAYISREDRPEWATIGMMGKLRIRKGQQTGDRWIKMRDISDTVEEWLVR